MRPDLRLAARGLARTPGFAAVAVLSLGLGIGANLAVFRVVHAALLQPVDAADPERLAAVYNRSTRGEPGFGAVALPEYEQFREARDAFSELAGYVRVPFSVRFAERAERIPGELATASYFPTLGLRPAAGRFFLANEDREEAAPVAVLSHRLWRDRFGADPQIVGRTFQVAGHFCTIVGVAPTGFRGVTLDWSDPPELWIPFAQYRRTVPAFARIDFRQRWEAQPMLVFGRLQPGITREAAAARLETLAARLDREHPERTAARPLGAAWKPVVLPISEARIWPARRAEIRRYLTLLTVAVGMVLLIACLNLASLILARAERRRRDTAVRVALGANRAHLLRPIFAESLLLALSGAAAALFLVWTVQRIAGVNNGMIAIPLAIVPRFDAPVIGFTLLTASWVALLLGWIAARSLNRSDLTPVLKGVPVAGQDGWRRFDLRDALLLVQVAVSLVLLTGAGLFLKTLKAAAAEGVTPQPGRVLLARVEPLTHGYDEARGRRLYERLTAEAPHLPGVRSAGMVWTVPLTGIRGTTGAVIERRDGDLREANVHLNVVSSGYFETAGLAITRGRDFTIHDREGSSRVVIVNEELARRHWPGEEPVGRRVRIGGDGQGAEVVGVVRDGKYRSFREPAAPCLYTPLGQVYRGEMSLMLRTAGNPYEVLPAIEDLFTAIDPGLPLARIQTMESHLDAAVARERTIAALLSVLGLLALAIAMIGMYGVLSFQVARRRREMAIRLAVGARAGQVAGLVAARTAFPVGAGLGLGLLLAAAGAHLAASLLYGVEPFDIRTYAAAAIAIVVCAAATMVIPARRAARTQPADVLRNE